MKRNYRNILTESFDEAISILKDNSTNVTNNFGKRNHSVDELIGFLNIMKEKLDSKKTYSACSKNCLRKEGHCRAQHYYVRYKRNGKTIILSLSAGIANLHPSSWDKLTEWEQYIFRSILSGLLMKRTSTITYEVISGYDIMEAYKGFKGELESCMSNSCSRFTELYAINPDKCSMVIQRTNGCVNARALIWNLGNGNWYFDRVYSVSDYAKYMLILWSVNNKDYNFTGTRYNRSSGTSVNVCLEMNCEKEGGELLKEYPYIDSFSRGIACLDEDKEKISKLWLTTEYSMETLNDIRREHQYDKNYYWIAFGETDGEFYMCGNISNRDEY